MDMKKIAVLFPGIGYTCDKPLLYYTAKICMAQGYTVKPVPYGNFESGIKGNQEKMQAAFFSALHQAEELLQDIRWEEYGEILFVSKSVGTIVAGAYADRKNLKVRNISYTPVDATFQYAGTDGIMFHGTADPWAQDDAAIEEACKKLGLPLYLIEGANHSLETGEVQKDLENMKDILLHAADYIRGGNSK